MSEAIFFYHGNCYDGAAAAGVFRDLYRRHTMSYFYPLSHTSNEDSSIRTEIFDKINSLDIRNSYIYFLDFCPKKEILIEVASKCKKLVVLDHHKTAEANLKNVVIDNAIIKFDMNKSGAMMAFDYVKPDNKNLGITLSDYYCYGFICEYIEDADLYRWNLESSRIINEAIRLYEPDINLLSNLAKNEDFRSLFEKGIISEKRKRSLVENVLSSTKRKVKFDGHILDICNCPSALISDVCNVLYQDNKFGIAYYESKDGIHVSLRSSDDGVDVSEIAEFYGGGGHRNAAAFVVSRKKFYDLVKAY